MITKFNGNDLPEEILSVAHVGTDKLLGIVPKMANRHGLIAGATGTGKTVSLQVIAEAFSKIGVPVFMADMKGDLSGIAKAGKMNGFMEKRAAKYGLEYQFQGFPVEFFDVFEEQGNPIRTTIDSLGASLLGRILELNDTQLGVLNIVFRVCKDDLGGKAMHTIEDLRHMLTYVSENSKELSNRYGNVTAASVGAIQRALLRLEEEGGDKFIGGPCFDVAKNLIRTRNGEGVVNILAADKLSNTPLLYSTFLFWMLSYLYENLPEIGDCDKPKFVFFFDEAHMLFDGTQKAVLDKIEQTVRLIRSKGVGVYFITQNPTDIPDGVLSQLGNKVQHALRAFTPKDQKAIKSVAEGFRENPAFKTDDTLIELETGEALVSFLDAKGAPTVVERAYMLSPAGQIGPIDQAERKALIDASEFKSTESISSWVSRQTDNVSVAIQKADTTPADTATSTNADTKEDKPQDNAELFEYLDEVEQGAAEVNEQLSKVLDLSRDTLDSAKTCSSALSKMEDALADAKEAMQQIKSATTAIERIAKKSPTKGSTESLIKANKLKDKAEDAIERINAKIKTIKEKKSKKEVQEKKESEKRRSNIWKLVCKIVPKIVTFFLGKKR